MRNALLCLALSLALLYFVGGTPAVVEALIRMFVLGAVQVITYHLHQSAKGRHALKKVDRHRLKKPEFKD